MVHREGVQPPNPLECKHKINPELLWGRREGQMSGALAPKWHGCFRVVLNPRSPGNLNVSAQANKATFKGLHSYFWGGADFQPHWKKVKQREENNFFHFFG